jgi:hypothetical protein
MNTISIVSTISKSEFQDISKTLRKSIKVMKMLPILGYIFTFVGLVSLFFSGIETAPIAVLIMGLNFIFLMPYLFNRAAKKAYDTNPLISEEITYSFNEDTFYSKGESFSSEISLDKFYKVSESDEFLFLWTSKQVANAISKSNMKDTDMEELNNLFSNYPQIINELR